MLTPGASLALERGPSLSLCVSRPSPPGLARMAVGVHSRCSPCLQSNTAPCD